MTLLQDEKLYYVGGIVRDSFLGVKSFDTDYCYEGNAIEFAKNRGLNIIKTNEQFGTVKVKLEDEEIDIASTRKEIYPRAGHLPVVVEIGCSLKEDLLRRDFSINAMAKNTLTGNLVDYFNGQKDISNKKLRVLHNKSFIDDSSRILRALKFSARFGFELEENTRILQENYLSNINYDVSFSRLKKELKETFDLNKDFILKKFVEENLYKLLGVNVVVPNFNYCVEDFALKLKPKNTWLAYVGAFNLQNFDLTVDEQNIVNGYLNIKNNVPIKDFEIYKMFEHVMPETVILYANTININVIERYLQIKDIKLAVNGNDLKIMGIKSGKIYKLIFETLLKEKLKNPAWSKLEEIEFVKNKFLH